MSACNNFSVDGSVPGVPDEWKFRFSDRKIVDTEKVMDQEVAWSDKAF